MTDRHATTADLPGWNIVETVLGLSKQPGASGWIWLKDPVDPRGPRTIGRDISGRLYADSNAVFVDRPTKTPVEQGLLGLLVGVHDGLGLWVSPAGYSQIMPIDPDEPGTQPDVPRWLPIREVLAIPAEASNLIG